MDTEQNMAKDVAQVGQDKKNVKGYRRSDKQLAYKEKAVKDVTEFAERKKDEMQELISKFEAKWQIGLRWDSKVPQNGKWYHLFTLKASDRDEVIREIKEYLNLYKEIHGIESVKDANDEEGINSAYDKIQDLYKELSSMVEKAKTEKQSTSSSTVFNLHKDIIARETQIVNKLEKVELSISRQQVRGLTNKLDSALKACDEYKEQTNTLQKENEKVTEECKRVIEENKRLGEKCDEVVEENKRLGKECDRVVEENKRLGEKCDRVVEEMKGMMNFIQETFMSQGRTAQNEAINQGAKQQGAQAQFDQQQKPNAQATSTQQAANVSPMSHNKSSSPSSSSGEDGNQAGPSSKLSGVQPISRKEAINSLAGQRKYRVLWWGFGPTLLESLCKKKGFNAKKLLEDKFSEGIKEQCITLLEAFGEEKLYWWWPWSGKVNDAQIDEKQCQRAREYGNYSWFWKIVFGLFTSVLIHCRVLQWNSLVTNYYGGCMFKKGSSEDRNQARNRSQEVPTTSTNISDNLGDCMNRGEKDSESVNQTKNINQTTSTNTSDNLNKGPDLMTLGDVLKLFGLPKLLQKLDVSLEEVRRHIKGKKEHEQRVKDADKEIRNLSLKYHPDRVQNRGGSDKEVAQAKEIQTALGTTRTVLNSLTKAFLEDLDIDYKYAFYAKIEISSLGNEDEVNKLNSGVLHKLVMLSEIKQEKIIARINKFLKASQCSVKSFTEGNVGDFEKNRRNALLYLSMCIDGYKKLVAEDDEVEKECKEDEKLERMGSLIRRMARESSRQLNTLRELERFAEGSIKGRFQNFPAPENVDKYFVLPFVKYINVLLICSKVCSREKNESKESWQFFGLRKKFELWRTQQGETPEQEPDLEQEGVLYGYAYYLASYFNDNSKYGKEVRKALGITEDKKISIEKVINRFNEVIGMIKDNLEKEFKPDTYIEGGTKKYIMKEYAKWMKIMDDFLEKEEKRIKDTWVDIRNFQIKNKRLGEECKRVVEENKRLGEKCERVVEENKMLGEKCERVLEENKRFGEKYDGVAKEMREFRQKMFSYISHGRTVQNEVDNQEASTSQQQSYDQGANDQQHESGAQASCAQLSQQQEPNAQAANAQQQESCTQAANDQPNSKLGEVRPISRSQSLGSLHSSDSDSGIKIGGSSQCR
ncbi:uncharacterized protein TNCT_499301 [Trichonephila clavata]|uniref:J domain-containing protein n=1 Tax=Trichonephila clavata TaxID=2740835 RepID=A0A8X6LFX3_TRICU|nr:uncharacterized protein TNCT_499301 [Trichonephila clavata]